MTRRRYRARVTDTGTTELEPVEEPTPGPDAPPSPDPATRSPATLLDDVEHFSQIRRRHQEHDTAQLAAAIRKATAAGCSLSQIGEAAGLSKQRIAQINAAAS